MLSSFSLPLPLTLSLFQPFSNFSHWQQPNIEGNNSYYWFYNGLCLLAVKKKAKHLKKTLLSAVPGTENSLIGFELAHESMIGIDHTPFGLHKGKGIFQCHPILFHYVCHRLQEEKWGGWEKSECLRYLSNSCSYSLSNTIHLKASQHIKGNTSVLGSKNWNSKQAWVNTHTYIPT